MKAEDKKKVAETLTEKTVFLRIGLLPLFLKPLTLGQIYEMGEYVNDINAKGLDKETAYNVVAEMFLRYNNARLMQNIFLVCAFRSRWKRKVFKKYIFRRLTVNHFRKAIEVLTTSYSANFFLTSTIFLSQTKPMTEPT